jgi:hypothetical protein
MSPNGHVKEKSPFHFTIKLSGVDKQNFSCAGRHEDRLHARDLVKLPFISNKVDTFNAAK